MEVFNIDLELQKSFITLAGQRRVGGIATDESIDLDDEITLLNGIQDSLEYIKSWGKFNDNHSKKLIGEIDTAKICTRQDLVNSGYFQQSDVPANMAMRKCLYVEGYFYPKVKEADHYWRIMKSGARIGMSLQGRILQRAILTKGGDTRMVNSRVFVNQIAVTGEPKVTTTCLKPLFKSLKYPDHPCSGGCANCTQCIKREAKAERHDMLAIERQLSRLRSGRSGEAPLAKSMEVGSGIVQEGAGGASQVRTQSIEGGKKKKRKGIKDVAVAADGLALEKSGAYNSKDNLMYRNDRAKQISDDMKAEYGGSSRQTMEDKTQIHRHVYNLPEGEDVRKNAASLAVGLKGKAHHYNSNGAHFSVVVEKTHDGDQHEHYVKTKSDGLAKSATDGGSVTHHIHVKDSVSSNGAPVNAKGIKPAALFKKSLANGSAVGDAVRGTKMGFEGTRMAQMSPKEVELITGAKHHSSYNVGGAHVHMFHTKEPMTAGDKLQDKTDGYLRVGDGGSDYHGHSVISHPMKEEGHSAIYHFSQPPSTYHKSLGGETMNKETIDALAKSVMDKIPTRPLPRTSTAGKLLMLKSLSPMVDAGKLGSEAVVAYEYLINDLRNERMPHVTDDLNKAVCLIDGLTERDLINVQQIQSLDDEGAAELVKSFAVAHFGDEADPTEPEDDESEDLSKSAGYEPHTNKTMKPEEVEALTGAKHVKSYDENNVTNHLFSCDDPRGACHKVRDKTNGYLSGGNMGDHHAVLADPTRISGSHVYHFNKGDIAKTEELYKGIKKADMDEDQRSVAMINGHVSRHPCVKTALGTGHGIKIVGYGKGKSGEFEHAFYSDNPNASANALAAKIPNAKAEHHGPYFSKVTHSDEQGNHTHLFDKVH